MVCMKALTVLICYFVECVQFIIELFLHVDYEDVDLNARLQMVNLLRQRDERDTIPYATAAGDILVLRKALQKYPQEVRSHA